jgi:hypothetical protein
VVREAAAVQDDSASAFPALCLATAASSHYDRAAEGMDGYDDDWNI